MITGIAFLLILAAVHVRGGDLSKLAGIRPRHLSMVFAAIALQVVIISLLADSLPFAVASALHLTSYGLALGFVWLNRRIPGIVLLVSGGILNLVAIMANGGVMPATVAALEFAGKPVSSAGFENSTSQTDAKLVFLGDVFALPEGMPFANVFSLGDIVLLVGGYVVVSRACGKKHVSTAQLESEVDRSRQAAHRFVARAEQYIREPLAAIVRSTESVSAYTGPSDLRRHSLDVLAAAGHIEALLTELVGLASVEARTIPLELGPARVHDIVADAVERVMPLAAERSVQIRHVGGRGESVWADPTRLRQIVYGLLSDAVSHNGQPGAVSVIHETLEDRTLITVADNGPGMSAGDIDALLAPRDASGAPVESIAARNRSFNVMTELVHLMNGRLRIQSGPGRGTTFTVELPAHL